MKLTTTFFIYVSLLESVNAVDIGGNCTVESYTSG